MLRNLHISHLIGLKKRFQILMLTLNSLRKPSFKSQPKLNESWQLSAKSTAEMRTSICMEMKDGTFIQLMSRYPRDTSSRGQTLRQVKIRFQKVVPLERQMIAGKRPILEVGVKKLKDVHKVKNCKEVNATKNVHLIRMVLTNSATTSVRWAGMKAMAWIGTPVLEFLTIRPPKTWLNHKCVPLEL